MNITSTTVSELCGAYELPAVDAFTIVTELQDTASASLVPAVAQLLRERSAARHWLIRAAELLADLRARHHVETSQLLMDRIFEVVSESDPCNCTDEPCRHKSYLQGQLLDKARAGRYANSFALSRLRTESALEAEALDDLELLSEHLPATLDLLARFYALKDVPVKRHAAIHKLVGELLSHTATVRGSVFPKVEQLLLERADRLTNRIEPLPKGSAARARRRRHFQRTVAQIAAQ